MGNAQSGASASLPPLGNEPDEEPDEEDDEELDALRGATVATSKGARRANDMCAP